MSDLISRQAAIDACDQSINLFEAVDRIKELPSVTQKSGNKYRKEAKRWKNKWLKAQKSGKWIPVSERLPEIDEPVLIFHRYYEGIHITIGRYHSDEEQGGYRYWQWIKYDNHFSYGIDHFGIICPGSYYVDAWMPLPEPYKAESEG